MNIKCDTEYKIKTKICFLKEELDEEIKNINSRSNFKNEFIHPISNCDYENFKDNSYLLKGYYNNIYFNLENEIKLRKEQRKIFNLDEIKLIYFSVMKALYFLQINMLTHGDIKPENISIDLKNKIVKLDETLGNTFPNKFGEFLNSRSKNIYMSPILFENLINKVNRIRHNPHKSDIFCFGLIILEIGILKNVNDIYDFDNKCIDINKLNNYKNEFFSIHFSKDQNFCQNLEYMIKIDENERLDAYDLIEILEENDLKNYENNEVNEEYFENNENIKYSYKENEKRQVKNDFKIIDDKSLNNNNYDLLKSNSKINQSIHNEENNNSKNGVSENFYKPKNAPKLKSHYLLKKENKNNEIEERKRPKNPPKFKESYVNKVKKNAEMLEEANSKNYDNDNNNLDFNINKTSRPKLPPKIPSKFN